MKHWIRAARALASSARVLVIGAAAGVVAVYMIEDYSQSQLLAMALVAIAVLTVIEFLYLTFEAKYEAARNEVERAERR